MVAYIVRRTLLMAITLIGMSIIIFALLRRLELLREYGLDEKHQKNSREIWVTLEDS